MVATFFTLAHTRSGGYPQFTLLWTAMGALLDRFALPSCGQKINVWGLVAWIEPRISQALNKRINCLRTHMTSVCLLSQSRSGSERVLSAIAESTRQGPLATLNKVTPAALGVWHQ
jgi:hypothetical protein